jgi:tRNA pseudouridine38-40 synthase
VDDRLNIRLDLAYVGTRYHGWQVQPGKVTVQGILQDLLSEAYKQRIVLHGSGRTDAGTHARGQVANFHAPARLPVERLPLILNSRLPEDIRVLAARVAPAGFHARKSARGKIYLYRVYTGRVISPFRAPVYHHRPRGLDLDAVARAMRLLEGKHDFTSFCAHAAGEKNRVRTLRVCRMTRRGHQLHFRLEADGFLHHMVRNIVGTLLEVGDGNRPAESIPALLAARDRRLAGPTAPARGLTLLRVLY